MSRINDSDYVPRRVSNGEPDPPRNAQTVPVNHRTQTNSTTQRRNVVQYGAQRREQIEARLDQREREAKGVTGSGVAGREYPGIPG